MDHSLHTRVTQVWDKLARQYTWRLKLDLIAITEELELESNPNQPLDDKALEDRIKWHAARYIFNGLRNQDQAAAEDLMLACERKARQYGVAEEEVADMAAETVRRVIQGLPAVREPGKLLKIAFITLYRLLRTLNRLEIVESDLPPNTLETHSTTTELEALVAQRLMYDELLALIKQKIPNDIQRAVVIRAVFLEETPRDIAAALNLPPEQVRLAKSRGLQRLRETNEVRRLLQSESIDVQ